MNWEKNKAHLHQRLDSFRDLGPNHGGENEDAPCHESITFAKKFVDEITHCTIRNFLKIPGDILLTASVASTGLATIETEYTFGTMLFLQIIFEKNEMMTIYWWYNGDGKLLEELSSYDPQIWAILEQYGISRQ